MKQLACPGEIGHGESVVLLFAGRSGAISLVKDGDWIVQKEQGHLENTEVRSRNFEHPKPILRCIPFFFEATSIPTLL
jgi:hypothetical protein